jgi:uncharacterized protein YjbJ (UPF0337 family)
MSRTKGVKKRVSGNAKRLVGEVLGDQELHDEGRSQERQGENDIEEAGSAKPLGNLDKLT